MGSHKFKKGWHRFILGASLVLFVLIVAPLSIRPIWPGVAREIRDWIEAYSGFFLIIAAMIAAYPVYLQLEDSKINSRKMIVVGKQTAFENEGRRVRSIGPLVETVIQLAIDKRCDSISANRTTWLTEIMDVRNEIAAKIDNIPTVSEKRRDFANKAHEFCQILNSGIPIESNERYYGILIHIGKELQRTASEHNGACHTHRESLTKELLECEREVRGLMAT
jgi:hypothetical protein